MMGLVLVHAHLWICQVSCLCQITSKVLFIYQAAILFIIIIIIFYKAHISATAIHGTHLKEYIHKHENTPPTHL